MKKYDRILLIVTFIIFIFNIGSISAGSNQPFRVPMIDNQLRHLPYTDGKPRINKSEYTAWPVNHGDAHVTLWEDDKYAALTVTIDDNNVADHPAWLELQRKYGFVATWFSMTRKKNDWKSFQTMMDHGNDVQSHTTNHVDYGDTSRWPNGPDSTEVDSVYRLSVVDINTNLKGARCLTIAYPFGWADHKIADKYFVGGRGVGGMVNKADNINYMGTYSGFANTTYVVDALLNPKVLVYGKPVTQGWLCMHYHGMDGGEENYFSHLAQKMDSIWVTWFRNVILFGQERDTHTLTIRSVSDSKISFDLTDLMDDSIFDYPLTVKVRVNNDWGKVTATQNGNTIPAKVINHEGDLYVLVKAVPDRGLVEVNNGLYADVSYVGDKSIKITPDQNYLNIKGTVKGDLIDVYNLNGIKLKSIVASGDESKIELKKGQIVLVKIRNKTYKVIM